MILSLILAIVAGWIAYGVSFGIVSGLSGAPLKALSMGAAMLQGLPGLLLQLILVPFILRFLQLAQNGVSKDIPANGAKLTSEPIISDACEMIKRKEASCVVIKNGEIIYKADGRGVSPLLVLYREAPESMIGAVVVDKIIGKAAAMILVLGGVAHAYGVLMSVEGKRYLEQHDIKADCGRCVDVITGRDGNGICPIERSVLQLDDPEEGLQMMSKTIEALRSVG